MKSICVYCGSSDGNEPVYKEIALSLGKLLASRKITLIYGGAQIGIMGAVASACLKNGGEVIGIIPEFLDKIEITNKDVTELIQTKNMHERKTMMVERADAFIALPGGFGTLEELTEVLTWAQLGLIQKPIGILNIDGFYDCLLALIQHMHQSGFIKDANLELFVHDNSVEGLLQQLENFPVKDQSYKQKLGLT